MTTKGADPKLEMLEKFLKFLNDGTPIHPGSILHDEMQDLVNHEKGMTR